MRLCILAQATAQLCQRWRNPAPAADAYAQRVAALLFIWATLGWLLPTLLLLPDGSVAGAQWPATQQCSCRHLDRLATRIGCTLEAWLQMLLPAGRAADDAAAGQGQRARLPSAAAWWATLLVAWALSCTLAPLFKQPA